MVRFVQRQRANSNFGSYVLKGQSLSLQTASEASVHCVK